MPPNFYLAGLIASAAPWFNSFAFSFKFCQLLFVSWLSLSSLSYSTFSAAFLFTCADGFATRLLIAPKKPPIL
jgi:hypothetical protein